LDNNPAQGEIALRLFIMLCPLTLTETNVPVQNGNALPRGCPDADQHTIKKGIECHKPIPGRFSPPNNFAQRRFDFAFSLWRSVFTWTGDGSSD